MQRCQLTNAQVDEIRERALEFLIAEWPVLDAKCERIAANVAKMRDGNCAVFGGPLDSRECPEPSHHGYTITFDEATLEPLQVYWLAADR